MRRSPKIPGDGESIACGRLDAAAFCGPRPRTRRLHRLVVSVPRRVAPPDRRLQSRHGLRASKWIRVILNHFDLGPSGARTHRRLLDHLQVTATMLLSGSASIRTFCDLLSINPRVRHFLGLLSCCYLIDLA